MNDIREQKRFDKVCLGLENHQLIPFFNQGVSRLIKVVVARKFDLWKLEAVCQKILSGQTFVVTMFSHLIETLESMYRFLYTLKYEHCPPWPHDLPGTCTIH